MGGINFSRSAVSVLSTVWLCRNWRYAAFVRRLGEAAARGAGECGPCPHLASNTLSFALQIRKIHGKTSVRVRVKLYLHSPIYVYSWRAQGKIFFSIDPIDQEEPDWRCMQHLLEMHIKLRSENLKGRGHLEHLGQFMTILSEYVGQSGRAV